jgi:hypothetical protein
MTTIDDFSKFTYDVDSYQDINKEIENYDYVYIKIKNYNKKHMILNMKIDQLYKDLKQKKVAVVDFDRYYVIIKNNRTHTVER